MEEEYVPRHAAGLRRSTPESKPAAFPGIGLCNPEKIFTPEERLELERDLAALAMARRRDAANAAHIVVD